MPADMATCPLGARLSLAGNHCCRERTETQKVHMVHGRRGGGERGANAKPDLETPHRGAPKASQLSLASALDSLSVLVRFPTSLHPSALSVEKLGCSQRAPCRVVGDSRKMSRAKGVAPGLAALKFSAVLAWALLCQLLHTLINRFRFLCLRGSLDTGHPSASLFL